MSSSEPWKGESDEHTGDVEYGLLWRFLDPSKSFVLGVETGIIYERMQRGEESIASPTHSENEEELRNLANSFGYRAFFASLGEHWQATSFTREPRSHG
jgi:hypothetical protein